MTTPIEIINTRHFPVDRQTLFDAFSDPEKLAAWWGPEGFVNHITAFDLKPGGHWLITMTADNGTDFHNRWTFEEVLAGELVRSTSSASKCALPRTVKAPACRGAWSSSARTRWRRWKSSCTPPTSRISTVWNGFSTGVKDSC